MKNCGNSWFGQLMRRCAPVLCLLWMVFALAGCSDVVGMGSGVAAGGVFPVEIGDVTVPSRPAKAVVLSPSLADVVLALGCETQLAAGSEDCVQDSLRDLEKVPAGNAQAVLDLSPDLVLTDPGHNSIVPALREAGVTVLEISPAVNRADFERLYSQVSSAFLGGEAGYDQGITVAQDIFLVLDSINRIVPKDKVTTACYLYDIEGRAVTGDMLGSTIMTYSGVTNVFDSLAGGNYDFDSLKVANPNVIFCVPGMKDQLEGDAKFRALQAVVDGRVFELDPSLLEWQGRTVIETAYEISAAAFPQLLEENSMVVTDPTETIEKEVSSAAESAALESAAIESALAEDTTEYETLEQGNQGDAVLRIQERLEELGYLDTEYDGHYGEHTASCVSDFQKSNGLEPTGIADPDTQRRLFSRVAVSKGEAALKDTSSEGPAETSLPEE